MERFDELIYTAHALRQMFARSIDAASVRVVVETGDVIADYPDDKPYPSRLVLGFPKGVPLHVVVANDVARKTGYIVTVYVPDPALWEDDFQTRKKP